LGSLLEEGVELLDSAVSMELEHKCKGGASVKAALTSPNTSL
jgi:hypothetical protein